MIFYLGFSRCPDYNPPKKNRGFTGSELKKDNLLVDGHYLLKRSIVEKVGSDFPFNDSRRLLLFDGYLFRMKIMDKLIRLTINDVYELEVKYLKNVICNNYFSCFERLDIIILKCYEQNLNRSNNNDGLNEVVGCFRDVNELGVGIFNKLLSLRGKSTNDSLVVYFDIWVNTHKHLCLKASRL